MCLEIGVEGQGFDEEGAAVMLLANGCTTDVSNQVDSDRDMVVATYATMVVYCNS